MLKRELSKTKRLMINSFLISFLVFCTAISSTDTFMKYFGIFLSLFWLIDSFIYYKEIKNEKKNYKR